MAVAAARRWPGLTASLADSLAALAPLGPSRLQLQAKPPQSTYYQRGLELGSCWPCLEASSAL